jgi:hypothetical protein
MQENPFSTEFTGALTFDEAAKLWLETNDRGAARRTHFAPLHQANKTEKDLRGGLKTLGLFFSGHRLADLKSRELSEYQRLRWPRRTVLRKLAIQALTAGRMIRCN